MDPRNPLGRLDRLSRHPAVAELSLTFAAGPSGARRRVVEVRLTDGRRRGFELRAGQSYLDLLDRLSTFLSNEREVGA